MVKSHISRVLVAPLRVGAAFFGLGADDDIGEDLS